MKPETAAFSRDGENVAFFSMHETGRPSVWVRSVRGGGEPSLLVQDAEADLMPVDWHGDSLLVQRSAARGAAQGDLWVYSLADGTLEPYVATEFDEGAAAFSPDGHHVAYTSDESGRPEVYVQPFPADGERWGASLEGGRRQCPHRRTS